MILRWCLLGLGCLSIEKFTGDIIAYGQPNGRKEIIGFTDNNDGCRNVFKSVQDLAETLLAGQPYKASFNLDDSIQTSPISITFTGPQEDIPKELEEVKRFFDEPRERFWYLS